MDERGPAAVADAPLEPALAVDARVGVEDRAQSLADLVVGAHGVSLLVCGGSCYLSGFVPAIQMITRLNFPSASKSKKLQLCMSFFEPSFSSPM